MYSPSGIDRLNDGLARLSIRPALCYVVLGLSLVVVQQLVLWLEAGTRGQMLLPVIIFNGLFSPFLLALIHILDKQALAALNAMHPVLDATESESRMYGYRLSHMPCLRPLIAGLSMVILVILMERVSALPIRYEVLDQTPIFAVVFHIVDKLAAYLLGVFVYHTIRQLRLVNTVNSHLVRVDLFNLRPLQAFSKLTASTSMGLVVGVYGWMLINPELLTDPASLVFVAMATILAILVFVWPLYGIHRLMKASKEGALQEIESRFGAAFSEFNQLFDGKDDTSRVQLNGTIVSLEIQRRRIEAIPVWPWRPEAIRSVLTVVGIPLVLAILQVILEQALGR